MRMRMRMDTNEPTKRRRPTRDEVEEYTREVAEVVGRLFRVERRPATVDEVCEELDHPRWHVSRYLDRAQETGRLSSLRRTFWPAVDQYGHAVDLCLCRRAQSE